MTMPDLPGVHTGFGWNPFVRNIQRDANIVRREEERLGLHSPQPQPPSPIRREERLLREEERAAFQPPFDPYANMGPPPPPFDPYANMGPPPPPFDPYANMGPPPPPPVNPFLQPIQGIQQEILSSELAQQGFPGQPFPFPGQPPFDPYRRHEEFGRRRW